MNKKIHLMTLALTLTPFSLLAQGIPGAADISHLNAQEKIVKHNPLSDDWEKGASAILPSLPVPGDAKTIHLTLQDVTVKDMTVFTPAEIKDLYASSLNQDITLDKIYEIAALLTKRYREAGYFLSLGNVIHRGPA